MLVSYFSQIWFITFAVILQCCHANNLEVIQQFWKQLYNHLPDSSLPNRLSNGQITGVKISVAIERAEFGHTYDDYVCRATVRLIASWPIMDSKISDNTLVRMAGGSVLLDAERVWRPRVMVFGARHMSLLSRRLELQSFEKLGSPHRDILQNSEPQYVSSSEAASPLGLSTRRPAYVISEIFNVEVLCATPGIKNYLGAIHCPIIFSQETFYQENADYVWQDRTSCTLSSKAAERITYVTLSTVESDKTVFGGSRSSLAINLCFNPTAPILRAALSALVLTILCFILLWSLPCGPLLISVSQGVLILLCLATWTHFAGTIPSRFTLVDAWFILCLSFITLTFLVTLYEHRRLDRLVKTRKIQQQRRIYSALSVAVLSGPKMTLCGVAGGNGGGGSGGSTCGCGGCSCVGGYCGASGGFIGLSNGQANTMGGGGSPPPLGLMHHPSPIPMPAKLDICNEACFRSASSELSKDSSAIMSLEAALRLRCAKNGGLSVFEANDSNLGLLKSQYTSNSIPGAPPAPSGSLLQPLGPIPPSYCTTVVAVVLPIMYILAVIVFWGVFGAQGTVPKDCLVGSINCQALDGD